jgi:hypothetical protein
MAKRGLVDIVYKNPPRKLSLFMSFRNEDFSYIEYYKTAESLWFTKVHLPKS